MRILISGCSIAGPTLAYWLGRSGHQVTVVERADEIRTGGYPIDVTGGAVQVIDKMGLRDVLQRSHVQLQEILFVDAAGKQRGRMDVNGLKPPTQHPDLEIPRGALVHALYDVSKDAAEYLLGDSIATLTQDAGGVDVTFRHAAPQRYDLVVGADGLHSLTRRIVFGDEAQFIHPIGPSCFAAADVRKNPGQRNDSVVLHNEPGKMVSVYEYQDRATALFAFPCAESPRDPREQKALVRRVFSRTGWRVPALLDEVLAAPDFYFDSLAQIRMPQWSSGRVVLVGDAAYCPAFLTGQGTSLAITGAHTLALALQAADHVHAFAEYERQHRPLVSRAQASLAMGRLLLMPRSATAIRLRDSLTAVTALGVMLRTLQRRFTPSR